MVKPHQPKWVMSNRESIVTFVLMLALLVTLMYALPFVPFELWIARGTTESPTGAKIGVTCALVGIAIGAYCLRETYRIQYGCVELCIGLAAAWTTIRAMPNGYAEEPPAAALIQSVGAIYIMVRGLDNVAVGMRQRR